MKTTHKIFEEIDNNPISRLTMKTQYIRLLSMKLQWGTRSHMTWIDRNANSTIIRSSVCNHFHEQKDTETLQQYLKLRKISQEKNSCARNRRRVRFYSNLFKRTRQNWNVRNSQICTQPASRSVRRAHSHTYS